MTDDAFAIGVDAQGAVVQRLGHRRLFTIDVQITAADAASSHPHQHLARCRLRAHDVGMHLDTACAVEYGCLHVHPHR
jgi:hypothetical protein